jgi:hypothetical protein
MESEINEPELLDNCVRCHKSDNQLIKQSFRKALGIRGARFYTINYSICKNCYPYLEKGIKLDEKFHSNRFKTTLSGVYLVIYIVSLVILFTSNPPFQMIGIIVAVLVGGTLGSFCLLINLNKARYKTHPENMNKYFEIKNDGMVILKDLESNREINRINLLSIEKKIAEVLPKDTYEFCPNCGSQIKTYSGYCQSCGKNLKKS